MITLSFNYFFCYNYNKKTEVNFHEKFQKSIIVFVTLFSMLGFISISTVFADNTVTTSNTNISTTTDYSYTGEIVPYKTS